MLHPRTAMFVLEMGSMEASHAEVCFVNFESIPPFNSEDLERDVRAI